jgi:hypothetical protein
MKLIYIYKQEYRLPHVAEFEVNEIGWLQLWQMLKTMKVGEAMLKTIIWYGANINQVHDTCTFIETTICYKNHYRY